ncbi:MAG: pyruvate-formate lyase [Clostridia bacterium]|nr:pyruvate-formate lyase [Clostridia bacterium]
MKTTILRDQRVLSRIKRLHDDKMEINRVKLEHFKKYDTDDHGFIYDPDFHFTCEANTPDGAVRGPVAIGRALRKYLHDIPAYVNPASALAGAWYGQLSSFVNVSFDPALVPEELRAVWKKYDTYPGWSAMNHVAPDMTIGLELGWGGLKRKIEYWRDFNAPEDTSFYDGELEYVVGVQEWVARLAEQARAMAEASGDAEEKKNLTEIAEMNEWLVDNPPRTLREACQFIAHFQTIDRVYFLGGALDQLDELLRPWYERDVKKGIVTDDEAVWYIASLFFNDTHYSQLAGLTPDGSRDTTSRMSFLILEAMHVLGIPANIALRVHDGVNKDLLRRSLEYTMEDGSGVSYSMSVGTEKGFARNGYPEQLGRLRKKVGCNWTVIPGIEYALQDCTRANLAFAFKYAMDDLRGESERTLEKLFECFSYHTGVIVDSVKQGYDIHYENKYRNCPEIVLNPFMHGCVEHGLDCSQGGVDILDMNIDGIGLTTVADSFAAIEQRVVEEKRISWDELYRLLDSNWENAEPMRLMMKNVERFGAPHSRADKWAVRIRDCFVDACKRVGTPKHNLPITPGMFSHGNVYIHGQYLPATPNGRFAGDPICHSNEPDPGFARSYNTFSPSLKATAVAMVQPGYGNSSPLHLDVDTDMLAKEGGIEALIALIHAHNHMGGTLINLNCLSKQTLMEAHADPSTHPDLVVRVTGYSAFFASLSKEYRQQVVDRFLSKG